MKPLTGEEGMEPLTGKRAWNWTHFAKSCLSTSGTKDVPNAKQMPDPDARDVLTTVHQRSLGDSFSYSGCLPSCKWFHSCLLCYRTTKTKAMLLRCECAQCSTLNSLALSGSSFTLPYFALLCALPLSFPSFTWTPTSCSFAKFSGLHKVWTELGFLVRKKRSSRG